MIIPLAYSTEGPKVRRVHTNFEDVESIWAFTVSVLIVLFSVLDDLATRFIQLWWTARSSSCGVSLKILVIAEIRLSRLIMATECNFSFRLPKR
jgi:hypothetical protein